MGRGEAPARADDAGRLKIAQDLVTVTHAADNMRAVMPVMADQMRMPLVQQGIADKSLIDLFLARFQQRLDEGIPQSLDLVAAVYAKEFSEEDLGNLPAFYRTPTGQHLIDKTVLITEGMLLAGHEWGRTIGEEVGAEIDRERGAGAASHKL